MLLHNTSFDFLTDDDAYDFFIENEKFIMGAYSQYSSMFPDLNDDEISVLTLAYLLYGSDSDVPDSCIEVPENLEDEICDTPFLLSLLNYIMSASAIHSLAQKGIIKTSVDKKTGKKYFSLTDFGKDIATKLKQDRGV